MTKSRSRAYREDLEEIQDVIDVLLSIVGRQKADPKPSVEVAVDKLSNLAHEIQLRGLEEERIRVTRYLEGQEEKTDNTSDSLKGGRKS